MDDQTHIFFNEQPSQTSTQNQSTISYEENKIECFRLSQLAWGYTVKAKILKWFVKIGDFVQPTQIVGNYLDDEEEIRDLSVSMEGQVVSMAAAKAIYNFVCSHYLNQLERYCISNFVEHINLQAFENRGRILHILSEKSRLA